MQVEAIGVRGSSLQQVPKASDNVDAGRKTLDKGQPDLDKVNSADKNGVQPEEILNQIKALTENGLYSVRFEKSQEFDELIVKIVDTKTNEVIRQVPSEEVLGVRANMDELLGKIVNTTR